ncbi:translocation/assembly module TamB domain-containing protein [Roseococcus sp. DSY-14]|uniref:translocation/assembly module TamB domain-containing protein n=1 Tax=Roseococcus sp. DSY-14 TaxID=3369650 RepID=UPI00387AFA5A
MRRFLLLLLLLPVLLLGGAWAALQTSLPATLAARLVPGLEVEGLEPGLPRALRARRLTYADARGSWLVVEQPEVILALPDLLRGQVTATRVAAREVRVLRWPEGDPQAAPSSGPLVPRLPVAVAVRELDLPRVVLPEATLSLAGSATLAAGVVEARLRAREEAGATLDLDARLDGERLRAEAVAEDPQGRLAGAPAALRLRLDGPAAGAPFTLSARYAEATAELAGTASRAGAATRVQARGPLRPGGMLPDTLRPLAAEVALELDATVTDAGAVRLGPSRAAVPAGEVRAEGDAFPAPALAVTALVTDPTPLAALLPEGLRFGALALRGRLAGPSWAEAAAEGALAPDGLATGIAAADALLGPAPRLEFRLRPDLRGSRLALEGAALDATLEGDLGESLAARGTATVRAIPGGVEGAAELSFTAEGPRADPTLSLDLRAGRLAVAGVTAEALAVRGRVERPFSAPAGTLEGGGTVQGLPLRLDLAARPEGQGARVERGRAEYGPAVLELSGLLEPGVPRAQGRARLEVADLAPFSALAGQPLAGRLATTAEGDSAGRWRLEVEAPELALAGQAGSARLALAGERDAAEVTFAAQGPLARLSLAGRATLAIPLEAEIRQFALESQGETLRLTAPARLRYAPPEAALTGLRATTGQGGTLAGEVTVSGEAQALAGRLSFTGLPLGLARAALPGTPLRGALGGEIRLGGTVAVPEAQVTLRGTGLGADTPDLRALPPGTLAAEARLRGADLSGTATLSAGAATRLSARFRVEGGATVDATLTGEADLGVLSAPFLAGGADRVTGRIGLNARAEGPLAAPRLSGTAELRNIAYANPDTGVRLDGVSGRAVLRGDRVVLEGVRGRTGGGGSIALSGSLQPLDPLIPVDLRLTATRARYASPDYGEVTLDAALTLTGALRRDARLGGRVTVVAGELRVPDRLSRNVVVLVPFREVGRTPPGRLTTRRPPPRGSRPAQPEPALSVALDVTIEAPGRLYLRGRGLDTELAGRLQALGTLARPEIRGELRTQRGTFTLAGRNLALTRGVLRFDQGSLIPSLDVLATARTANYTITVGFSGPANEPAVVLESNPPLPQDEVLARLLFDRGTNRLSPFEIIGISEALAQLTGVELPAGGPGGVLASIRRFLGLDSLGVAGPAQPGGAAGAQAGRYLLPGVYLGLRQGTDGQTGLGIEAEITPRLKLEGSAGTAGERLGATYSYEW